MSRRKNVTPDGIVVVVDVGLAGKSFIETAIISIQRIIGSKLLFDKKDLLSVIAFGSHETNNAGMGEGFEHINRLCDLQEASFELLRDVEHLKATELRGDWVGASVVALLTIKESELPMENKKIILFSPMSETVDASELKKINRGLQKLNASLVIIGPDMSLLSEEENGSPDVLPLKNAIRTLMEQNDVTVWSAKEGLRNLTTNFTSRGVQPAAWKVDLEIGSRLKIRVAGYNEIAAEPKPKFKTVTQRNMASVVTRDKAFFEKGNKRQRVDDVEVIQGHKFGTTVVPFSTADRAELKFKAGPKCLKVVSFVIKNQVSPAMYVGVTGCQSIFASREDPVSQTAFSALVLAMYERNMVALARKVAKENGRLLFVALVPVCVEGEEMRLVLHELPFADDTRRYRFKQQAVDVTEEHLAAVDELMDNMNLEEALPGKKEAFSSRQTPDPSLVHLNEMLLLRALLPEASLPRPSGDILELLEPPASIKLAQEKLGPMLNRVFTLASNRRSTARPGTTRKKQEPAAEAASALSQDEDKAVAADNLPVSLPLMTGVLPTPLPPVATGPTGPDARPAPPVIEVGCDKPAEDFLQLMVQGRTLPDVCQECLAVVLLLATKAVSAQEVEPPLAAIRTMREKCQDLGEPFVYNECIRQLRDGLEARDRPLLWEAICKEGLGENGLGLLTAAPSMVTEQEAEAFLAPLNLASRSMEMELDDIE